MEAVYTTLSMVWLIWLNRWTLASIRHDIWGAWQIEHVILPPFGSMDLIVTGRGVSIYLNSNCMLLFPHKIYVMDSGRHDEYKDPFSKFYSY